MANNVKQATWVRRFFLQAGRVQLLLQLLSEGEKSRIHPPPLRPPHMEQSRVPCDGSSSLMRMGSISLCLTARAANNDNYESSGGKKPFYCHEISGVYPAKGEFFMSWMCTRRHASRSGTCAGPSVPSVTCWCHLIWDSSSSAQLSYGIPKIFTASVELTTRMSRKKAILRWREQGWSKAGVRGTSQALL